MSCPPESTEVVEFPATEDIDCRFPRKICQDWRNRRNPELLPTLHAQEIWGKLSQE